MKPIPRPLLHGPFHHAQAEMLGVSPRMLMGRRFVRLFPRVHRHVDHVMSDSDWVEAARLALPPDAKLTGISRIQASGLGYGPTRPIRFVVARDHHIDLNGIFLHRTVQMPPTDDVGVTLAAAFLAYCARARVIDAIKVGDWLLRNRDLTKRAIRDLALAQLWRDGANEALWIADHLNGDSRSLPESETRAVLEFAGLPQPEVNGRLELEDDLVLIVDLLYRQFRTAVEYEGGHHQADRGQYLGDLDRYATYRSHRVRYTQVTKERLRQPKLLVGDVYRELVAAGYDGPPPRFDGRWPLLWHSAYVAVGPRDHPGRAVRR